MVPTIGTTGAFSLASPYDTLIPARQQLKVVSVRALEELQASGEDPLNNIYLNSGANELSFSEDLANDIPVVTLVTDGGTYLYVPANKLLSGAKITGVKYVEKALIINLGYLPLTTDLALVAQLVNDEVYSVLGTVPDITPTDTSAIVYVDEVKHNTLSTVKANKKTVDKSYKTRYFEILELYNQQKQLIANIETVYANNGIGA